MLERCSISKHDAPVSFSCDHTCAPQFGEAPADGLDRKTEIICNVLARHLAIWTQYGFRFDPDRQSKAL